MSNEVFRTKCTISFVNQNSFLYFLNSLTDYAFNIKRALEALSFEL
jgi:hypothetical protein